MRACLAAAAAAVSLALTGCGAQPEDGSDEASAENWAAPTYIADGNPPSLGEWGQVKIEDGALELGAQVQPYDLNTALFTDYAHKLRTIWMPEGTSARYTSGEVLDFPVGTVITKTFYYPTNEGGAGEASRASLLRDPDTDFFGGDRLPLSNIQLIETRVLVRREAGWEAIPYRWNDEQTRADLSRIGAIIPLELAGADGTAQPFNYVMPSVNECASCHGTNSNDKAIWPIGPKARHLNRDFAYADGQRNQLEQLSNAGFLTGAPDPAQAPQNAAWNDQSASVTLRARAYLDINCSHCHSPYGPADTSGLSLEPDASGPSLGTCKVPIAAGAGTGNRRWGIHPGKPDDSILIYRMESDEADKMMPEIGRSLVHSEGIALVREWVAGLDGGCT